MSKTRYRITWNTGVNAAGDMISGAKQSITDAIGTMHGIIGSSATLGYDYVPKTVELRGIYEL